MRVRRIAIAGLVVFAVLGAGTAWACWSKTSVEGAIVAVSVIDPGTQTMDDQGVFRDGQWFIDANGDGWFNGVAGGDRLNVFK